MTHHSIATQKEICLAILRGEGDEAFAKHRIAPPDQLALKRCADAIVETAIRRRHPFRGYHKAKIRSPLRLGYAVAVIAAAASLAVLLWLISWIDPSDPQHYPLISAAATLAAVAAATTGWGVGSWAAYRNARVQHTINFVATRFTQPAFNENIGRFTAAFRGKTVDKALYDQLEKSSVQEDKEKLQAIKYMVNYFEFVSVGVLLGDLDEEIVRKTLRGNLNFCFDTCSKLIGELQSFNPLTLEHFSELRRHFRDI